MADITKQDVADFINKTIADGELELFEKAYLDTKLDPRSAEILIKLVGDVSFLVDLRDRLSNED